MNGHRHFGVLTFFLLTGLKCLSGKPVVLPLSYRVQTKQEEQQMLQGRPVTFTLRGSEKNISNELMTAPTPELYAYFASIEFLGGQVMDVLVDTGSANLLVPVVKCENCTGDFHSLNLTQARANPILCNDSRCVGICSTDLIGKARSKLAVSADDGLFCGVNGGVCAPFDKYSSVLGAEAVHSPDMCLFYNQYADGSFAGGFLTESDLSLGGLNLSSIYGSIFKASESFFEHPNGGGILGMSFGTPNMACNAFSCFPPLFENMVKTLGIPDVFSICGSINSPTMLLGGGDEELYKGTLEYVPLKAPYNAYRVETTNFVVGNFSLSKDNFRPAIMDTGTTGILMPYRLYMEFKGHMHSNYCHIPNVCPSPGNTNMIDDICVVMSDDDVKRLPDVVLVVGENVTMRMKPWEYTKKIYYRRWVYQCIQIFGFEPNDQLFLIGETLLNHYYVEFDRVNFRLGIAESVPNCTAIVK